MSSNNTASESALSFEWIESASSYEPSASSYEAISRMLQEASNLVAGERAQTYGDPAESHATVANLWSAYLGVQISPQDATIMLALLKIARLKNSPQHHDSATDAVAYLGIVAAHQNRAEQHDSTSDQDSTDHSSTAKDQKQ